MDDPLNPPARCSQQPGQCLRGKMKHMPWEIKSEPVPSEAAEVERCGIGNRKDEPALIADPRAQPLQHLNWLMNVFKDHPADDQIKWLFWWGHRFNRAVVDNKTRLMSMEDSLQRMLHTGDIPSLRCHLA